MPRSAAQITEVAKSALHGVSRRLRSAGVLGGHDRYRRFVLVCRARSGSTLVIERLSSHPQVVAYGEVFNPAEINWLSSPRPTAGQTRKRRDANPAQFLSEEVWHRYGRRTGAVGFKLLHTQCSAYADGIIRHLEALDDASKTRVIFLGRRNLLDVFVSLTLAQSSGVYAVRGERPQSENAALRIEFDAFRRFVRSSQLLEETCRRQFHRFPALEITYEDMIADPQTTDRRLCDFLGVASRALSHRVMKMGSGPARERIANFDLLREAAMGTELEQYFELP